MKHETKHWSLAIGFACAILAVSSIPAQRMPSAAEIWRWDKAIHAVEYAILATLMFRAALFQFAARWPLRYLALVVALGCAGFGILDELYQSTTPGRDSSGYDMLADIFGAVFASIGCAVVYSRKATREKFHGSHT